MNPEVPTTLLNTYPPTWIATIPKVLRERLKENDLLNAVQETASQDQKPFFSIIKS